jgi:hypothetical protein
MCQKLNVPFSRQESLREAWRSYARSVDLDIPQTKASAIQLVRGFIDTKNINFYYNRLGLWCWKYSTPVLGAMLSLL